MRNCRLWVVSVLCAILLAATHAQITPQREPVRYTVRFPAPQTNYVEVEALLPTEGRTSIDLMMAVWTPGSYLIREYERHVESVTAAANGRQLAIQKTAKNRWRILTGGARVVTLRYRVYCHEMTVRTNWVDADVAILNGAPTFISLADASASESNSTRPHDVGLELPPQWKTSISALAAAPDDLPNHYRAADYDTLVDSPIIAGNPSIHTFTVDDKPHHLVDVGDRGVFDAERAQAHLMRIIAAQKRFWGSLPYDRYLFFNLLTRPAADGADGLEHRNSVMMMASRWATGSTAAYRDWLSTASHEFFHLWNVKRLRPIELGPFDYEREVHTRSLWIAEGLTDYYGDLLLHRAGLTTRDEYLHQLSSAIQTLQTTPGRLVQPLELASFDAWIKHYRPDENSINSSISYYTKGAVVGFLLDARIRAATAGSRSLDDVMRLALTRYSGARGYKPDQFRQVVNEVAGTDLRPWLVRVLETPEELSYSQALDWFGLEFRASAPEPADSVAGWFGASVQTDNNRLYVSDVPKGTPAYAAGVNPGDEIVGIGDSPIDGAHWLERLESFQPQQMISFLLARRGELKRVDVTLGSAPPDRWTLDVDPNATAAQRSHLTAWLR